MDLADRGKRGLTVSDAEFQGNESGWNAVDYKLLVKKDRVEEQTKSGLFIPSEAREQEMWNISTGVLVSAGGLAFTQGRTEGGDLIYWEPRPKIGDRIMVKEFTGQFFKGADGDEYHVFTDKDIIGVKQ